MNRRSVLLLLASAALGISPVAYAGVLNFGAREYQVMVMVSSPQAGSAQAAVQKLADSTPGATPVAFDDAGGPDHPCWMFDYVVAGKKLVVPQSTSAFPVRVTVGGCEGQPQPNGYGMFGDAVVYVTSDSVPGVHLSALQTALRAPHDTGLAEVDTQALAKGVVKTTPMAPYVPKDLPPFAVYSTSAGAKQGFAGAAAIVLTGPKAKLADSLDAAVDAALDVARKSEPKK